jgi:hypothetical protein
MEIELSAAGALVAPAHPGVLQPIFKGDHVVVLHGGRQLTMTRDLRDVEQALKFA